MIGKRFVTFLILAFISSFFHRFTPVIQAAGPCSCVIDSVDPTTTTAGEGVTVSVSGITCNGTVVNNQAGFDFHTDIRHQPFKSQSIKDIPASAIVNGKITDFVLIKDNDGPNQPNPNFFNAGQIHKLNFRDSSDNVACHYTNDIYVADDYCSINYTVGCDPSGVRYYWSANVNTNQLSPNRDYKFWLWQADDPYILWTNILYESPSFDDFVPGTELAVSGTYDDADASSKTFNFALVKTDTDYNPDERVCIEQFTFPTTGCSTDPVPIPSALPDFEDVGVSVGICEQIPTELVLRCNQCVGPNASDPQGIWTAVGCIPTTAEGIVQSFITLSIGIAGGFAVLLILFGSFIVSTSTGNPDKLKSGQDMIVAAISGVVFILFSVILLQVIGVEILRIPGFFN